ncbi:MAG TPA: response regulator [bacterium]|nr:response regulator [bacterium]
MSVYDEEILIISDRAGDISPIQKFFEVKKYNFQVMLDVKEISRLPELETTSVCLLDLSMKTSSREPMHRWVYTHTEAEIIGLCERMLADYAKKEIKQGYLNDYLIINPQYDIGRLEFMLRRIEETKQIRLAVAALEKRVKHVEETLSTGERNPDQILMEVDVMREHIRMLSDHTQPIKPRTPRVLIATDNAVIKKHLLNTLQSGGYLITEVPTGEDAVNKARSEQPNLILLDVNTRGLNGFEAVSMLKKDRDTAKIPVMILSDAPTEEMVLKAKHARVEGFLTPPFHPAMLSERIQNIFFQQMSGAA